ncbi:hypothetical protein [Flavisolibacter nicotianae]|uniref:hypothetical protein n=1 Tax=Flavisolibacter nicotianae TaxID=2364882 RepID=UPI000EACDBCD|nr:hypothetical protein [Flavisolibacter nicotianae]
MESIANKSLSILLNIRQIHELLKEFNQGKSVPSISAESIILAKVIFTNDKAGTGAGSKRTPKDLALLMAGPFLFLLRLCLPKAEVSKSFSQWRLLIQSNRRTVSSLLKK